uniref:Uncharacterized protein n=1 Tax=Moniliophthora roreri TaxID=221103 RepID=A0A0W0F721_MONRR
MSQPSHRRLHAIFTNTNPFALSLVPFTLSSCLSLPLLPKFSFRARWYLWKKLGCFVVGAGSPPNSLRFPLSLHRNRNMLTRAFTTNRSKLFCGIFGGRGKGRGVVRQGGEYYIFYPSGLLSPTGLGNAERED